jgi:hypothetical protein
MLGVGELSVFPPRQVAETRRWASCTTGASKTLNPNKWPRSMDRECESLSRAPCWRRVACLVNTTQRVFYGFDIERGVQKPPVFRGSPGHMHYGSTEMRLK